MKDRSFIVICSLGSTPAYVPEAGKGSCSKCGAEVNVAPSTVAMMEADPAADWALHCIECAVPLITEGVPVQPLTALAAARDRGHAARQEGDPVRIHDARKRLQKWAIEHPLNRAAGSPLVLELQAGIYVALSLNR